MCIRDRVPSADAEIPVLDVAGLNLSVATRFINESHDEHSYQTALQLARQAVPEGMCHVPARVQELPPPVGAGTRAGRGGPGAGAGAGGAAAAGRGRAAAAAALTRAAAGVAEEARDPRQRARQHGRRRLQAQ